MLRTGVGDARWLTRAAANAVAVERAVPEAKGCLMRQAAPQAKRERRWQRPNTDESLKYRASLRKKWDAAARPLLDEGQGEYGATSGDKCGQATPGGGGAPGFPMSLRENRKNLGEARAPGVSMCLATACEVRVRRQTAPGEARAPGFRALLQERIVKPGVAGAPGNS